jgi:hypothetical protein
MRELRAFNKYDDAIRVHIGPSLGTHNAEMLGREGTRRDEKSDGQGGPGTGPRDRPAVVRKRREHGLMAPKFVRPYRKSGKNDSNDAEAIFEAASGRGRI